MSVILNEKLLILTLTFSPFMFGIASRNVWKLSFMWSRLFLSSALWCALFRSALKINKNKKFSHNSKEGPHKTGQLSKVTSDSPFWCELLAPKLCSLLALDRELDPPLLPLLLLPWLWLKPIESACVPTSISSFNFFKWFIILKRTAFKRFSSVEMWVLV